MKHSLFRHPFYSVHQHSRFSANDALPHVSAVVAQAAKLGYPALALTDHGTVAGCVQLYKECRKYDIAPLPGIEAYTTPYLADNDRKFMHLTINAYTEQGYRNLITLATKAQRNFRFRPRLDMVDFAAMHEAGATEGLMVTTGCHFGLVCTTTRDHGYGAGLQVTKSLARWFPKVFVELQHHGIHDRGQDSDAEVAYLLDMAEEAGLPYIITSDAHYVEAGDRKWHDGLKKLASWSDDPDDAIFPGIGSYHMPDARYLAQFFEPDVLATALDNLAEFAGCAKVRIPELENFSLQCPDVTMGADQDSVLRKKVHAALNATDNFLFFRSEQAAERVEEELEVIETSGMAGYMLLVADVCEFMLANDIWFHARGSASGSLVCRLLGITQIDPLAWGLRFDRFLSRDRTRPPDIDLDVSHIGREQVATYLESRYVVRQISTHMTYSIKGDEEMGEDSKRGSLMIRYHSLRTKQGHPHLSWMDIPPADQELLERLGDMELFSGYGTHPAGFVLASDEATINQLPLTWIASSKTMVTTYDKKDVEALGMVKLDVLGLKEVTALKISCAIAGITPVEIPMNDAATFKRISAGRTEGVFQLKGYAMKRGCQSIKPRKMSDLADAQALFRPAAMHSGATSDYRMRRSKAEPVPERHNDIMIETKETYGVLLYQEQVIGVLRRMNMPADELTDMLDAVKSSGKRGVAAAKATIEKMTPRISELAETRGWNARDVKWLADALGAYADYSFNKAHAATYAEVAYRSAWMAEHHKVAFWTGLLTVFSGTDKERELLAAARGQDGLRVLGARINLSGISYTPDVPRGAVRRGLLSVKGVGRVAAAELVAKGPFTSLRDLGERCVPKKVTGCKNLALGALPAECGGIIAALFDAGALDSLEN